MFIVCHGVDRVGLLGARGGRRQEIFLKADHALFAAVVDAMKFADQFGR